MEHVGDHVNTSANVNPSRQRDYRTHAQQIYSERPLRVTCALLRVKGFNTTHMYMQQVPLSIWGQLIMPFPYTLIITIRAALLLQSVLKPFN